MKSEASIDGVASVHRPGDSADGADAGTAGADCAAADAAAAVPSANSCGDSPPVGEPTPAKPPPSCRRCSARMAAPASRRRSAFARRCSAVSRLYSGEGLNPGDVACTSAGRSTESFDGKGGGCARASITAASAAATATLACAARASAAAASTLAASTATAAASTALISACVRRTRLPSSSYRSCHLPPLGSITSKAPVRLFCAQLPRKTEPLAMYKIPSPSARPLSNVPWCTEPSLRINSPTPCGWPSRMSPMKRTPSPMRILLTPDVGLRGNEAAGVGSLEMKVSVASSASMDSAFTVSIEKASCTSWNMRSASSGASRFLSG